MTHEKFSCGINEVNRPSLHFMFDQSTNYLSDLNKELKKYEEEILMQEEIQETPDAINYWKRSATMYPILSQVALDLVCVPVTEVSVERLFSHLAFILNPLRNRLTGDILEDILFLRMNKRFGIISGEGKDEQLDHSRN